MRPIRSRKRLPHFEIPGGICHLTWRLERGQRPLNPLERSVVRETILRDHELGCTILAGVVMDDHVHVLYEPIGGRTSMELAAAWKSITSHRICGDRSRQAPLWQRDSYQRWMRTTEQIESCAAYIRDNPRRRWPGIKCYPWLLP